MFEEKVTKQEFRKNQIELAKASEYVESALGQIDKKIRGLCPHKILVPNRIYAKYLCKLCSKRFGEVIPKDSKVERTKLIYTKK